MKTYFIDIDGTILKHHGAGSFSKITRLPATILDGVIDFFEKMGQEDSTIVLTTARHESMRQETEQQLKSFGLFWDHLIMGLPIGPRIVINDLKPDSEEEMAIGINVERNGGLKTLCE